MEPTQTGDSVLAQSRTHPGPAMALAALVAVLHLSVLAGRPTGRMGSSRGDGLTWRAPACGLSTERSTADNSPANPTQTYSVGRLSLDTGIAVIALAAWLHVMRINGATGR